jgi:hypothetical protein
MHGMDVYPDGILLLEKIPEVVSFMFCCVVSYDDMIHIKIFSFLANCDLYSFLLHFFGGSFIRVQLHRLLHDYEQCRGLGGSVWVAICVFFFFFFMFTVPALLSYYILVAVLRREALGVFGS